MPEFSDGGFSFPMTPLSAAEVCCYKTDLLLSLKIIFGCLKVLFVSVVEGVLHINCQDSVLRRVGCIQRS